LWTRKDTCAESTTSGRPSGVWRYVTASISHAVRPFSAFALLTSSAALFALWDQRSRCNIAVAKFEVHVRLWTGGTLFARPGFGLRRSPGVPAELAKNKSDRRCGIVAGEEYPSSSPGPTVLRRNSIGLDEMCYVRTIKRAIPSDGAVRRQCCLAPASAFAALISSITIRGGLPS